MQEIYIVHSMGCATCAYVNYYAALDDVLKTITDLTGESYTGSTQEELDTYLDDNCDIANIEKLDLYDD